MEALSDHSCSNGGPQSNHQILGGNGQLNGAAESRNPMLPGCEKLHNPAKSLWKWILCISTIFLVSGTITALGYWRRRSGQEGVSRPPCVTSASQQWIQNGTWEYLFSKTEVTWDESWKNCSCYGASLVPLDTPKERVFIEVAKLLEETWIDLRRESPAEPWRYSNGIAFDDRFNIENPNGHCAYWNVNHISSTTCDNTRYYVCRRAAPKPE